MSSAAFVDRVFANLPARDRGFQWKNWRHADRPTNEGVGILQKAGIDVDKLASKILDVDDYRGNIEFVDECRTIPDPSVGAGAKRFYQRIKLPLVGAVHHELVIADLGERDGWRVIAWHQHPGTANLNKKQGARSDYNVGAWLLRPDAVGYALSSAPRKDDVGRLKFAALTKGADAGAAAVLQKNIEGMIRWSQRG